MPFSHNAQTHLKLVRLSFARPMKTVDHEALFFNSCTLIAIHLLLFVTGRFWPIKIGSLYFLNTNKGSLFLINYLEIKTQQLILNTVKLKQEYYVYFELFCYCRDLFFFFFFFKSAEISQQLRKQKS